MGLVVDDCAGAGRDDALFLVASSHGHRSLGATRLHLHSDAAQFLGHLRCVVCCPDDLGVVLLSPGSAFVYEARLTIDGRPLLSGGLIHGLDASVLQNSPDSCFRGDVDEGDRYVLIAGAVLAVVDAFSGHVRKCQAPHVVGFPLR